MHGGRCQDILDLVETEVTQRWPRGSMVCSPHRQDGDPFSASSSPGLWLHRFSLCLHHPITFSPACLDQIFVHVRLIRIHVMASSFSISPSSEYSVLISFRIDWFDLLAVQGTLKGLLQHHNSTVLSLLYGIEGMNG